MAILDINRNLGPSVSQSETHEAIGHAEDLSPIITNIAPETSFFLSEFPKGADCTTLEFSWMTEGLRPPRVNAHLEKENYENADKLGSLEGMKNHCQRFVNSGYVTEAQRKVAKTYSEADDFTRELQLALTAHASDIEFAITHNTISHQELNATTPAMTGGVPFFMDIKTEDAAITTAGLVTTTNNHMMETGDFVYFTATTMPEGLAANTLYYVEVTGDKTFYIYDNIKDAAEKTVAKRVKPTNVGAGLAIVKNNVVDLQGTTDFTLEDLNNVMEMCFQRGGNPTLAVMSPAKKRRFSQIINSVTGLSVNRAQGKSDRRYDMVGDVLETDFGVITAKPHRLYSDNRIDIMDMNYWEIKWFVPTHQVDGIAKKGSYDEFYIESWLGLKGTQPKASGSIVNVKR